MVAYLAVLGTSLLASRAGCIWFDSFKADASDSLMLFDGPTPPLPAPMAPSSTPRARRRSALASSKVSTPAVPARRPSPLKHLLVRSSWRSLSVFDTDSTLQRMGYREYKPDFTHDAKLSALQLVPCGPRR